MASNNTSYQLVELEAVKLFIPTHFICSNASDMVRKAVDPIGHFSIPNLDSSHRLHLEQPFHWLLLGGGSSTDPHNFYAFVLIPTFQITNQLDFNQWKQSNAKLLPLLQKINEEIGKYLLNRSSTCKLLHQAIAKNFEEVFQIHSILRHGSLIHMYQMICKEWTENKSKQYGKNLERIYDRVMCAWKMQQLLQLIFQVEQQYKNSSMDYWKQSNLRAQQQQSNIETEMQSFLPLKEAFCKCLAKCERNTVLQQGNQIHKLPAEIRAILLKSDASVFSELQANHAELEYTGILHREVVPEIGANIVIMVQLEYNHEKTQKSWRRASQRNVKQMIHFYTFSLDITIQ